MVGQIVPSWVGGVVLVIAIVTAVGTVMNPQQGYFEHLSAAKAFTAIKHDARALQEVFGVSASDRENAASLRGLHDRYNDLVMMSPPTEDWAFDKARQRIQQGVHRSNGKR